MLETVKYLIGSADPSGYGSKSTAEEVTQHCPDLCSIITDITMLHVRMLSLSLLILHTKELALRLKKMEANVKVNSVHPGIVRTRLTGEREGLVTDLVFFLASKFLKTIPKAAATTCYVATHPRLENAGNADAAIQECKYLENKGSGLDCNEVSTSKLGLNLTEAARIWSASEIMVAKDFKAHFVPFEGFV